MANSFGDSGGPLIQYDSNGSPVLVGIVQGGSECGSSSVPYRCTKIAAFSDFLPSNRVARTNEVSPEFYSDVEPTDDDLDPVSPSPETEDNVLSQRAVIAIAVSASVVVIVISIILVVVLIRQCRQD